MARAQDTIQMFSRLNPQVQTQVLTSMGLPTSQVQQMVTTIGQNRGLQADSPNIVSQWNTLFGSNVNVDRLGSTIFSGSVHPEDADHNYHNYGAISFTPGQGLQSNAASGQYGEPNHRGLRQLQPYILPALGLAGAAFGLPGLGSLFSGGAEVGGAIGADAALTGAFDSGIAGGLEGGITPSLYGGAVEPFAGAAGSAATAGAGFTPSFSNIRSGFNVARGLMSSGNSTNSTGGSTMPTTSSGGFDFSSILGLLGIGHSAFGGGVGTASGALDNANHAADVADPWASHRAPFQAAVDTNALGMLGIGQNPADAITSNPAYQFDLDQGTKAINVGDAAQGTLRSGNRLAELQKYGTGLAASYWDRNAANNRANLSSLGTLAGVGAGSPGDASRALTGGFDNASNIRNAGQNSLFSGGSSNPLSGLLGMLGSGASGVGSWLSNLFSSGGGGGGFDMSSLNFGNLPNFNDTSGFNPGDFISGDGGGLADATGAFW